MALPSTRPAAPTRARSTIRRWAARGLTAVATAALSLGVVTSAAASPSASFDDTAYVSGTVYAIAYSGDRIFIGGDFTAVGGQPRSNAAALRPDGRLDPTWQPNPDGIVRAIAASADGSRVFLGGEFLTAGGAARSKLAGVDAVTGAALPDWTTTANGDVLALAVSGDRVYAGGRFTEIGGVANRRLVAIDTVTGAVNTTFRPRPDWTVRGVGVSPDGSRVYAVGGFALIGGATRPGAAEVNAVNGTVTAFNPVVANGGVVLSMTLTPDGSRFFFSTESNRIFAYTPATSNTPIYAIQTGGDTQAMAASATELYFGGHFQRLNDFRLERSRVASVYIASGTPTDWNPGVDGLMGVWAVAIGANSVSIGGDFAHVGGVWQRGFARFSGTP
jgi:WD40 repeat protein